MFPDPDYLPARFSQFSSYTYISIAVEANFVAPELNIMAGFSKASWATMPETTINKNHKMLTTKAEVGAPLNRQVSSPAANSVASKQGRHNQLSPLVSSGANARHYLLTGLVKHIRTFNSLFRFVIPYAQKLYSCGLVGKRSLMFLLGNLKRGPFSFTRPFLRLMR